MGQPLPEEVYISKTETLPRALVGQCAKSGCKRCGGAGWFRFAHGLGQLFLCPCAQEKVRAKVTETKDAVNARRQRPILELVGEVVGRIIKAGGAPAAMVCSTGIGGRIREAAGERAVPVHGAAFTIPVPSEDPAHDVTLLVYPDPEAPPDFSTVLDMPAWDRLEKQIKRAERERKAEARREKDAAAELAQLRAELHKP